MAAAGVLLRLLSDPRRALAVSRQPAVLAQWEGVARVLVLKQAAEQKYLTKLEAQKGSDASARQATRALVSVTRQLSTLRRVLAATGASTLGASPGKVEAIGKNTLVRATLAEIANA